MENTTNTNEMVVATQVMPQVNTFAEDGFNLEIDLTTAKTQFCSMKAETPEEKAKLFNAMNNPEKRIKEMINKTIRAKDVYLEVVDCTNQETGEVTKAPRIVIIDDKGTAYQSVSTGVYSALKKIFQVYGVPTWDEPILLEVKEIPRGTNNFMLTLNAVAPGK